MSLAKKPSTALSQDTEAGVKWNVQRGCRASHLRSIAAQTPQGALKVPRAFGVLVGHLPSAILSLPAFVSRSPPDNSCITLVGSVGLCVRPGLPGASNPFRHCRSSQSSCHNQTDSLSGFPSGRLTSSNVATWVLSNQDSSVAPQTLHGFSAFVLSAAIASDNCRHSRNMRLRHSETSGNAPPQSN